MKELKNYIWVSPILLLSLFAIFAVSFTYNHLDIPVSNLIFNLCCGWLVSFFFFILVVIIPEIRKKKLIRQNLERHYNDFKEACISIFLFASEGSHDSLLPSQLRETVEFRDYFKKDGRWYDVANGLDDKLLNDLRIEIEIFLQEISFTFGVVNIEDDEAFSFFKRLYGSLYRIKNVDREYDGVKILLRFFWSLFAGWDMSSGYSDKDLIAGYLEKLEK